LAVVTFFTLLIIALAAPHAADLPGPGVVDTKLTQPLAEQVHERITVLRTMVSTAESKRIYVERERMTLRTADFFLRCANWDESHISVNEGHFKKLPNYKDDAASLAQELPDFERREVIKILNDAIERLGLLLDGTYTRKHVPKVDYSKAKLHGDAINRKTYMADVRANYESVFFEGIPLGFATTGILHEEDPSDWDAILIWQTETVTLKEFQAMQDYLNRGGTVIIDAMSFQKDEYGREHGQLRQGRGYLHIVDALPDMKQQALMIVAAKRGLPKVRVKEICSLGFKGCVWRCIKNRKGNHVLSIVNLGKSESRLDIQIKNAPKNAVWRDLLTRVVVEPNLTVAPHEVVFIEAAHSDR
jgi:beta-galactosidase